MAVLRRNLVILAASAFVFLAVCVPESEAGGCGCPPFWTAFQDHCYRYFATENITWIDAELSCRSYSVPCSENAAGHSVGHLVSIRSVDELDFVTAFYESVRTKRFTPRTWIGLHDRGTENSHEWSDGSSLDFTNWAPSQPNDPNGAHDCVFFSRSSDFGWNDTPCTTRTLVETFLCKLPKW